MAFHIFDATSTWLMLDGRTSTSCNSAAETDSNRLNGPLA